MKSEDRAYLNELKQAHTKRIKQLRIQEARLGVNCPPEIVIEISDIEAKVDDINRQLAPKVDRIKKNQQTKVDSSYKPNLKWRDSDKEISITMSGTYWALTLLG